MAILNNSNAISAGGYDVNNSLRFRSSASAYLNRTFGTPTNNKIWTWSSWIKRGALGTYQHIFDSSVPANQEDYIRFTNGDVLQFSIAAQATSLLVTSQVLRDPSAYYHLVLAVDTTQATASNRVKIYINGVQVTSFTTANYPSQNAATYINSASSHSIGSYGGGGGSRTNYLDGYLTEINFIDGQALTPSSFGNYNSVTGVWQPAKYSGTYGTNGFYLKFSDIATTSGSNAGLGKDFSGNGNYWTTNNISVTSGTTYDAMKDSPTNTSATVANYCTLNPVFGSTNVTLSEANLKAQVGSTGGVYRTAAATFGVSSGKWYWELVFGNPTTGNPLAGVGDMTVATSTWNADTSTNANFWYVDASNGNKINGTGGPGSSYGSSFSTTDICMVALDMDNGKIWWGKNGTWFSSGDPAAGTNAAYTNLANKLLTIALMGGCGSCGFSGNLYQLNFGQRPFSYTPPTGFLALNTFNLPTPTILQGNKYMDATLYTGNGFPTAGTQSITNASAFQPDYVWIKDRSSGTNYHALFDSIRGTNNRLFSNTTDSQNTTTGTLTAFNSNGFTLGSQEGQNANGNALVAWQWQAGKGSSSSNTNGSITSTVSVNASAGFSIVTYTGTGANATVGHGLGVAPSMIIVKNRTTAGSSWNIYHKSVGATGYLQFTTAATTTSALSWNNTSPTSSVFSIGTGADVNTNTANIVAYCWAEIAGFSKFTSYTGNGSADGPFVYCGFRPKWIMFKRTDSSTNANWMILDTSRNTYNVADSALFANLSNAELTSYPVDILSNGFKIRGTTGETNVNGGTFIVAAFAENPFKNSLAR